jgi:hypothetical protein
LRQLQLIQILSIKDFGCAVPHFAAKMAARINPAWWGSTPAESARGTRKQGPVRGKSRQIGAWAVYPALTLSLGGVKSVVFAGVVLGRRGPFVQRWPKSRERRMRYVTWALAATMALIAGSVSAEPAA